MRRRRLLRRLRFGVLLAIALVVAFAIRGHQRFTIPETDSSLAPDAPGGSTVIARVYRGGPIGRGDRVVYEMEREGTLYARFGIVRAVPGDEVLSRDGLLCVNGERVGPLPIRGETMGRVPEGSYLVLSNTPVEKRYPDSRQLGFIPESRIRGIIRFVFRG